MIVYWTKYEGLTKISSLGKPPISTGLRTIKPIQVENIIDNKFEEQSYKKCPAFSNHLKNLFYISAPIDYDLNFSLDNNVTSNSYDQKFFDEIVLIRDNLSKLYSLRFYTHFVSENEDLEISMMPAYLHKNSFVDNTVIVPGTFNIGKWPRALEPSFHVVGDNININEGDPLYYVKFHTNKKIQFKEFIINEKFLEYSSMLLRSRDYKVGFKNLSFYYDLLKRKPKFRKMMIEEIKKNVLE